MIKRGFTLVELLVTIVITGILSSMGVATFHNHVFSANDASRLSVIRNATIIIKSDEFISDQVNFADLDGDGIFGALDLVTVSDFKSRMDNQDYNLPEFTDGHCYLYGYQARVANNEEFIIITKKENDTGTGGAGFIFDGTQGAINQAKNVTSMNCATGSEGVSGGDWTDFVWLNIVP